MEISDLFKNALHYPTESYVKWLVVGVIAIVANLSSIFNSLGGNNAVLSILFGIIGIIFSFLLAGYILSVIKETVIGSDEIPDLEFRSNFIMGIKYTILNIIYFIIPTIIVLVVSWATGFFDSSVSILNLISVNGNGIAANATAINSTLATVPQGTWDTLITSICISVIVAIIVFIIFGLFALIAYCRLAETGRLAAGLNFKEIYNDISAIGWSTYIVWAIVFVIILAILSIVFSAVSLIPYVGGIIGTLIVSSFMILFMARSLGLIYASK